jgi:hypothetical protein
VSPVRYELGFYMPEDDILHSHLHEHHKSDTPVQILSRCMHFGGHLCGLVVRLPGC